MRWAGHVTQMEKKRNACIFLVGKSEKKKTLGRIDVGGRIILYYYYINIIIIMDLSEVRWSGVD
jgi:hypothetical protein